MNEFVSKFTNWYRNQFNGANIDAFKHALRKAVKEELPSRDNQYSIQVRDIVLSKKLKLHIDRDDFWATTSSEKVPFFAMTSSPLHGPTNASAATRISQSGITARPEPEPKTTCRCPPSARISHVTSADDSEGDAWPHPSAMAGGRAAPSPSSLS